jgi:hypothetical protein
MDGRLCHAILTAWYGFLSSALEDYSLGHPFPTALKLPDPFAVVIQALVLEFFSSTRRGSIQKVPIVGLLIMAGWRA